MKTIICHQGWRLARRALLWSFLGAWTGWNLAATANAAPAAGLGPRPLDGVNIEAVESYPNPREHSLGLALGVYPFNPYYTGLLVTGNYIYHFEPTLAWEIFNASYAYSVQNDLTTELADRYSVNPKQINRLNLLVSTGAHFGLLSGKFVLLRDYIKYFRVSAVTGLALAMTNQNSSIAPQVGLRIEVYSGDAFSWNIDIRDSVAISTVTNYVTFSSGINIGL